MGLEGAMPDDGGLARSSWLWKVGLSAALLAWLLRLVDVSAIAGALVETNLAWLAIGTVVYVGSQLLSGVKWHVLASGAGVERPLSRVVAYYFIGMFFNAFGFGTVGGDVMRAMYLGGATDRARAVNSVLIDRLTGLAVLIAMSVAALVVFRRYDLPPALYWGTLVLGIGLLVGWWLAPIVLPRFLPRTSRVRHSIETELSPFWRDYPLLSKASIMSFAFHGAQILAIVALARALDVRIPGTFFLIFAPLTNLASALPVSWNGLGVRESAYVFFLARVGVASEAAVALALLWLGVVLVGGAIGGIVYVSLGESRTPLRA